MLINEVLAGRYDNEPAITAFPNQFVGKETGFGGLLVINTRFRSTCSHHMAAVGGRCIIGIIPSENVVGLSKFQRIVTHLSQRMSLQEEMVEMIANEITRLTGSKDVGIYLEGTHSCMHCRGVDLTQEETLTQTTVLRGRFLEESSLRKEFHDNVMYQLMPRR